MRANPVAWAALGKSWAAPLGCPWFASGLPGPATPPERASRALVRVAGAARAPLGRFTLSFFNQHSGVVDLVPPTWVAQILPNSRNKLPILTQIRSKPAILVDYGPHMADLGQTWSELDQLRGDHRPNSAEIGPSLTKFGSNRTSFGRTRPSCANFGRTRSNLGRRRPNLARFRPRLGHPRLWTQSSIHGLRR